VACSRMSTGSDVGAIPAGPIKPMNLGPAPLRFSVCDLKVMNRMKKRGLLELSGLPFAFFEHPGVGSLEGSHFAASPPSHLERPLVMATGGVALRRRPHLQYIE